MAALVGRILCLIGVHDLQVLEVTYGFGSGGGVAKLRCRRCGRTRTRQV